MVYKQLFNPIKFNLTFSLLILTLIVFLRCFTVQVQAKQDSNGLRGVAKSSASLAMKLYLVFWFFHNNLSSSLNSIILP